MGIDWGIKKNKKFIKMICMENLIKNEITEFENNLKTFVKPRVEDYLYKFLFAKSKRLRPLLGILFLKSYGLELTEEHHNLFRAVELIHNASLIHDDIIDNSDERRNIRSINSEFDNSLAVSSGDLILALGMQNIINISNKAVQKMFTENMSEICNGEINQYFSKFKTPTTDEYIEKSYKKTALLFELSVLGGIILSKKTEYEEIAKEFSKNFGIAFQINNDFQNFLEDNSDFEQGIYTAPYFLGVEKTQCLINNYIVKTEEILKNLPNNEYSKAIKDIINKMRTE